LGPEVRYGPDTTIPPAEATGGIDFFRNGSGSGYRIVVSVIGVVSVVRAVGVEHVGIDVQQLA
jgi:hypothetical protein